MLLTLSYAILWALIGVNGALLVLTIRKLRIARLMIRDLEEAAQNLEAANRDAWAEASYGDIQYPNFFGQLERARDHLSEQSPDRGT